MNHGDELEVEPLNEMYLPNRRWDYAIYLQDRGQYDVLVQVGFLEGERRVPDQHPVHISKHDAERLRKKAEDRAARHEARS